ncbi:hypothetical protein CEE37_08205 [candidate division LCP-89 bacterium B3_LCP]|uniref:TonB C-terminal domain-containing protein n=1 Tax=candidate division LCP-89 bacterium B3_LCP TaxID=2012998 RepID=A0A532UZJ0_UNCL8|nr:MAG: hypothetical protein CEE37_08205 [candidate division LCP-89 bacterium B3_LCP]
MTSRWQHIRILTVVLLNVFIAFNLSSCVYFNTYYNAKKYFKEGEKDSENTTTGRPSTANYQKSIDSAARVIEYYPDSKYVDDAILLMGKSYYAIMTYPKARRKFDELLTNYPDSPLTYEARLYLGKTLIKMRRTDDGIALLNDLWLDEQTPIEVRQESRRTQADYFFDQESYYQALAEYDKLLGATKDKKERASILYQKGECHYELGEFQEAEQAYSQVSDEKPTRLRRFEANYKLALTLQQMGRLQDALKICNKLLKKDIYFSYYDRAYLAKAGVLNELGQTEEAIEIYKRILELYPRSETSAVASFRLGQIYMSMNDFTQAEEYLAKVSSEASDSEFVEEASETVIDLQYLTTLITGIDSLTADIDTLEYRLEWIAENSDSLSVDSSMVDSSAAVQLDTLKDAGVQQAGGDSPEQPGIPPKPGFQSSMPEGAMPPGYNPQYPGQFPQGKFGPGQTPGQQMPSPAFARELPTDSAEVYERIDLDRAELADYRFRLAEHLWTRFDDIDSANVIFNDIAGQHDYVDLRAKALLSLHYLQELASSDSAMSDSIPNILHEEYPAGEYDRWARNLLGLEPLPEPVDTVAEAYLNAENLWLEEESPSEAVDAYLLITEKWPDSDLAPQALYASAWIMENVMEDAEGAFASYDSLIAWYPESQYITMAKKKVAPPPVEIPDSLKVGEDTTGTVELADEFEPVPPGSGMPEIMGGERALSDAISQNRLYPPVALEASIAGEVILTFTVNSQGIPDYFEVLRETPDGFDFAENAIQVLQSVQFRPGYRDGQYIDSPMTQLVRFTP